MTTLNRAEMPRAQLLRGALLLLLATGCDSVLGLERPMLPPVDTQSPIVPAPLPDHDAGADDVETSPEPGCIDGTRRCESSTSETRFECRHDRWVAISPCQPVEQCDDEHGANCTPRPGLTPACAKSGVIACAGAATSERRLCDREQMVWVDTKPCAAGQACDRSDGSCREIVPACMGHAPGDFVCNDRERIACGQDLVTMMPVMECASEAHCLRASGRECALCLQDEYSCAGATLRVCNDQGDGWTEVTTCATARLCNAGAMGCTDATCVPGQHQCDGNRLLVCNADQSGFDFVQDCVDGPCDERAGECDVCVHDSCRDGATRRVCSDDGQTLTNQACPADQSVCTGDGKCVQCLTTDDCAQRTEGCVEVSCERNRCDTTRHDPGWRCGNSLECDQNRQCRDLALYSLTPSQAPPGSAIIIEAKPTRFIHNPNLVASQDAAGTTVIVHEDCPASGENTCEKVVAATVTTATVGGMPQRLTFRMPDRSNTGWSEREIVSIMVAYTPPSTEAIDGGVSPGSADEGILEFTYDR